MRDSDLLSALRVDDIATARFAVQRSADVQLKERLERWIRHANGAVIADRMLSTVLSNGRDPARVEELTTQLKAHQRGKALAFAVLMESLEHRT